jgi:hypothetical protein
LSHNPHRWPCQQLQSEQTMNTRQAGQPLAPPRAKGGQVRPLKQWRERGSMRGIWREANSGRFLSRKRIRVLNRSAEEVPQDYQSWPCEKAGALQRSRMAFKDVKRPCLLARGSRHNVHRWQHQRISETPSFPQFSRAAHVMPILLLCVVGLAEPAVTIFAPYTFSHSQGLKRDPNEPLVALPHLVCCSAGSGHSGRGAPTAAVPPPPDLPSRQSCSSSHLRRPRADFFSVHPTIVNLRRL